MRLFVAVNLPAIEKQRLADVLEQLRATALPVRWTDRDSLHLTMKFLGEVAEDRVAAIGDAIVVAAAGAGPFEMRVRGLGAFPSNRRPSVFWIGIDSPQTLTALQHRVEDELEKLGFAKEPRPFRPHIMIGRVRNNAPRIPAGDVDRIASEVGYNATVKVESIDLMRSHLGSRGARYETLMRAELFQHG